MSDITNFYREQGSGQPLILLHGNGEDSSYFSSQLEEFSKYYRVIALDTRGHGNTARGSAPFTIRQFARDLKDFMDLHQINQAHILGFSDGANIAMCFASQYPDRVRKLILNGGNLNPAGVKPAVQIPIEIGYFLASIAAKQSKKARKQAELLHLMVYDPNISQEELDKIQAETLVIAGTRDMIRQNHSIEIAKKISYAHLIFLNGDHFVARDNPADFNAAVLAFLKE